MEVAVSEEKVNLDKKVEELEAAAKKYASKDTVISVGGYDFTPAKLMIVATLLSSVLGALYGAFEVYKDYIGMKKKIAEYVAPDFSEFDKRLAVIEENSAKTAKAVQDGSDKTAEYTRDIKNDLKGDIRRLEKVVESVETSNKTQQREIDKTVQEIKVEVRSIQKAADQALNSATKEMNKMSADNAKAIAANNREVEAKMRALDKKINEDLKKALDNPLANK
jgi:tetrahydromethanopterin S-methyltransferase subunit F